MPLHNDHISVGIIQNILTCCQALKYFILTTQLQSMFMRSENQNGEKGNVIAVRNSVRYPHAITNELNYKFRYLRVRNSVCGCNSVREPMFFLKFHYL